MTLDGLTSRRLKRRIGRWHRPRRPTNTVKIQKLPVSAAHYFATETPLMRNARVPPRPIGGACERSDTDDPEQQSENNCPPGEDRRSFQWSKHDRMLLLPCSVTRSA